MSAKLNDPNNEHLCDPDEIALKSFFLGPQAENIDWLLGVTESLLKSWAQWRRSFHPEDGLAISQLDQQSPKFLQSQKKIESVIRELLLRFENELPKFSPRYVGHMLSEISLPALLGHFVTLLHNPNNISGEASRIGTQIEDEAIRYLRQMVGYTSLPASGHFTSGGTIANFEALIRARDRSAHWLSLHCVNVILGESASLSVRRASHMGWNNFQRNYDHFIKNGSKPNILKEWNSVLLGGISFSKKFESTFKQGCPEPIILVPNNKHYSWKKAAVLLGLGVDSLWPISLTQSGVLSVSDLKKSLLRAQKEDRPVLAVVSVLGSTELGSIDPVHEVQDHLEKLKSEEDIHIWHHVDGAYGGFYRTVNLEETQNLSKASCLALSSISKAESITLDPHKLGYVPYSSGAILVREDRDYRSISSTDAPYIDFNKKVDRGPFTIEGSRSAAGSVATWMLAQTVGLNPLGYGKLLDRTTRICRELEVLIQARLEDVYLAPGCDTNILCFTCAQPGESLSLSNQRTLGVYQRFFSDSDAKYIVSKTVLNTGIHHEYLTEWFKQWGPLVDSNEVILIRMCMMNPFFGSQETQVRYQKDFVDELEKVLISLP